MVLVPLAVPARTDYPPLFAATMARTQVRMDGMMQQGWEVPTPKDMAGGYTHEVHKQNWKTLRDTSALYRLTGDSIYAAFIGEGLLAYLVVRMAAGEDSSLLLLSSTSDLRPRQKHSFDINGQTYRCEGVHKPIKLSDASE